MVIPRRPVAETRAAIVAAAVRVIGEHGVDGLTHRAVARVADVSLSSTTYHFASKEAIVHAALSTVADEDLQRLQKATDAVDAAIAAGERFPMDLVVDLLVREVAPGEPLRVRSQHHLQLESVERADLRRVVASWSASVVQQTARVLAALGSLDPDADARLLTAAIDGLRFRTLTAPSDAETLRADVARLVRLVTTLDAPE